MTKEVEQNIQTTEMSFFRRLLGITYRYRITNTEVKEKIERNTGPYERLLTAVKKRKLKCFGHVSRTSGLAKTVLQGIVQGRRRRGGQRKRWGDNIVEWSGLRLNDIFRETDDRHAWRKLVAYFYGAPTVARLRGNR